MSFSDYIVAEVSSARHPDMSAFIGAALAVMLFSSFWKVPREFLENGAFKNVESRLASIRAKFTKSELELSCLVVTLEWFQVYYRHRINRLRSLFGYFHRFALVPLSVLLALCVMFELYLGLVQSVGYWNVFVLLPCILHICFCTSFLLILEAELFFDKMCYLRLLKVGGEGSHKDVSKEAVLDEIKKMEDKSNNKE